jgi:hypothetical protein
MVFSFFVCDVSAQLPGDDRLQFPPRQQAGIGLPILGGPFHGLFALARRCRGRRNRGIRLVQMKSFAASWRPAQPGKNAGRPAFEPVMRGLLCE